MLSAVTQFLRVNGEPEEEGVALRTPVASLLTVRSWMQELALTLARISHLQDGRAKRMSPAADDPNALKQSIEDPSMFGYMKHFRSLLITAFAVFCIVTGVTDVRAQQQGISPLGDAEKANCQAVYAIASARTVVDCPAGKGYSFCFTRELIDQANLITGKMTAFWGAYKGSAHPHNADTSVGASSLTITTADGALELVDYSLFDTKTREFAGIETVTGGTGKFEGYSGKLMDIGYANGKAVWMGTLCHE